MNESEVEEKIRDAVTWALAKNKPGRKPEINVKLGLIVDFEKKIFSPLYCVLMQELQGDKVGWHPPSGVDIYTAISNLFPSLTKHRFQNLWDLMLHPSGEKISYSFSAQMDGAGQLIDYQFIKNEQYIDSSYLEIIFQMAEEFGVVPCQKANFSGLYSGEKVESLTRDNACLTHNDEEIFSQKLKSFLFNDTRRKLVEGLKP